jgi:PAS domain S-box-containing protein
MKNKLRLLFLLALNGLCLFGQDAGAPQDSMPTTVDTVITALPTRPSSLDSLNSYWELSVAFLQKYIPQLVPFYLTYRYIIDPGFVGLFLILFLWMVFRNLRLRKEIHELDKKHDKLYRSRTVKLRKTNEHLESENTKLKHFEREFNGISTQLKEVHDELIHLRQLRKAVETMHLGVGVTDIQGGFLYTNHAFCDIYGYKENEMLGRNRKILMPEILGEVPTVDNAKSWDGILRNEAHVKKDSSIIQVQTISNLIIGDSGKPIAIITTVEDISDKLSSQEALKQTEANFRRIFENIQDIYYEVDIDGTIKEISPSIEAICGVSREELVDSQMRRIYYNDEQQQNYISALKKGEDVNDYEIMLQNEAGEPVPCTITAKLILDEAKLPWKIIGSIRNITERKKAENKVLETLRELQVANKDLTDFAYITSHDLKAPLRAINTIANWISMDYGDNLGTEGQAQLDMLIGRVQRMHNLIEGIFEYTNIINIENPREEISLNELVLETMKKLEIQDSCDIALKSDLPEVYFERIRMEQIFEHLMSNAVNFSDKERPQINIGAVDMDDHWKFFVQDNGPGIEERYFEKIFTIFQTLQSRDDKETTGIGLAMVKKIVEKFGGTVWVESTPGDGATFYFTFSKTVLEGE